MTHIGLHDKIFLKIEFGCDLYNKKGGVYMSTWLQLLLGISFGIILFVAFWFIENRLKRWNTLCFIIFYVAILLVSFLVSSQGMFFGEILLKNILIMGFFETGTLFVALIATRFTFLEYSVESKYFNVIFIIYAVILTIIMAICLGIGIPKF